MRRTSSGASRRVGKRNEEGTAGGTPRNASEEGPVPIAPPTSGVPGLSRGDGAPTPSSVHRPNLEGALQPLREWRLRHPSGPEQKMILLLLSLGLLPGRDYQREYVEPFAEGGPFWLDFAWPGQMKAIEVNGGVHQMPGRAVADRLRLMALREAGWDVLVVESTDLDRPETGETVRVFLQLSGSDG